MKKNKVLLIGPSPPPHGGIATYCNDIYKSDLKDTYEIVFFDVTIPMKFRPKFNTDSNIKNIFCRDGLINAVKQLLFVFVNFTRFSRLILKNDFKIIHIISCTGNGFWRNGIFILLAKLKSIKSIFHVVGEIDVFWSTSGFFKKKLIKFFLDISDKIIVQSEGIRSKVKLMTKTHIVSIINGVDTNIYNPTNKLSKDNVNELCLVTVGVLGNRKGYNDLIDLASILVESNISDIKFRFIGGGEVSLYKSIIKEKNLEGIIKIFDNISNEEKISLLKSSDVFVLPTYNEGQPISIIEAFCCGLPIISTNVGAIPEIINEKSGFLLNPGDLAKLKGIILKLYTDRELLKSISKYNQSKFKSLFSFDRVLSQLDVVYKSVLNR